MSQDTKFPHRSLKPVIFLISGILLAMGCEKSELEEVVSEGPCTISFHWYQKDSFQNYPKRIAKFWPPHTTTELDIQCQGESSFSNKHAQNNHGTGPDKIVHGIQVLQKIKTVLIKSTEAAARDLDRAYRSCECSGTYFSMEELNGESRKVFSALAENTSRILNCSERSRVVEDLKKGKISKDLLVSCGAASKQDWEKSFNDALSHLSDPLDSYHVCNNDAMLQANLIEEFVTKGKVVACGGDSNAVCRGPKVFYEP
ncbi:MAG: hypothetical protein AB8G05_06245 [Oligoflexales bacterium]